MKRILMVLLAFVLMSVGLVSWSAPASAHTGVLSGITKCEKNGTWSVLVKVSITNTPNDDTAETKAIMTTAGALSKQGGSGVMAGGQVMLNAWSDHAHNWPGVKTRKGNWIDYYTIAGIPAAVSTVRTMVQVDWKKWQSRDYEIEFDKPEKCEPPVEEPPTEEPPTEPPVTPPPTPEPPVCDDVCKLPKMPKSRGDLICNGSVVGGVYDDVVVMRGTTCVLTDVYINGSVKAVGARNLLVHDATIRGSVLAKRISGDVYFGSKKACRYDPLIGGSLKIIKSHNVLVCDMQVCKDITVRKNDGRITIRKTRARSIEVTKNTKFRSDGNAGHRNAGTIRLINTKGKHFIAKNAPRKVIRR